MGMGAGAEVIVVESSEDAGLIEDSLPSTMLRGEPERAMAGARLA
jgi:hypothetical protein